MRRDKFKLLFFGSDQFSIRILKHLLDSHICPVQVVTGANTLLDRFSKDHQLIRHSWREGLHNIDPGAFNIGVVASFGNLIDEKSVRKFMYGLFNVHPSLLPQYRGSTPIQAAVFDKQTETGCTIMQIPPVPKFDIGDIVIQNKLSLGKRVYALDLRDQLADLGGTMLIELLSNYDLCMKNSYPQDSSKKSFAKKLKPEQGHLKFKIDTLDIIDRKVRAYTGFIDLYMTCLDRKPVRLESMVDSEEVETYDLDRLVKTISCCDTTSAYDPNIPPPVGTMYFHKLRRLLCIKTVDQKWSAFRYATPVRKSKMSAADFYNGYLSKVPQQDRITDL